MAISLILPLKKFIKTWSLKIYPYSGSMNLSLGLSLEKGEVIIWGWWGDVKVGRMRRIILFPINSEGSLQRWTHRLVLPLRPFHRGWRQVLQKYDRFPSERSWLQVWDHQLTCRIQDSRWNHCCFSHISWRYCPLPPPLSIQRTSCG